MCCGSNVAPMLSFDPMVYPAEHVDRPYKPKRFGNATLVSTADTELPTQATAQFLFTLEGGEDEWRTVDVRAHRRGSATGQPGLVGVILNAATGSLGSPGAAGNVIFDCLGIARCSLVAKSLMVSVQNRSDFDVDVVAVCSDGRVDTTNQLGSIHTGTGADQNITIPNCAKYVQLLGNYSGGLSPDSYDFSFYFGAYLVTSAKGSFMPAMGWPLAGTSSLTVNAPSGLHYRLAWILDR